MLRFRELAKQVAKAKVAVERETGHTVKLFAACGWLVVVPLFSCTLSRSSSLKAESRSESESIASKYLLTTLAALDPRASST